jgi:hypothetical protein
MLDISNIPSQQKQTFTFYATGNWQTWNKPRGAKMIEIFCLGGGGGGGLSQLNASAYGGAGGGGSGGIVRGIVPAFLLPDTLYILVGKGGAGPTTPGIGGSGGISYVGLQPSTSEQTLICKSSTAVPTGGTSAFAGGNGGAAASISTISLSVFSNLGLFTSIAGVSGSNGGSFVGTDGASQSPALSTNLTTGGAGGAGNTNTVTFSGGTIGSASVILTNSVNGGVTSGQNGGNGYGTLQPFCGTGGAGGASSITGIGGPGGNGWYGCGGGGAGHGALTGNKGGNGGDGLIIITVIS